MDEKTIEKLDELGIDFFSLQHYKLIKLFNLAGIDKSEDIVDDMLTNQTYLEEYGVSQSLKRGAAVYFGKYGQSCGAYAGKPMAWKIVEINARNMILVSWFAINHRSMFSGTITNWEYL